MSVSALKRKVIEAVDSSRDTILELGKDIFDHPELGYREERTTARASEYLEGLGLEVERDIAVTGCRSLLNAASEGPTIALLGELDAIVVPDHALADDQGRIHACGHNIQLAGLMGAVTGLVKSGILPELKGRISVMGTPAEEFVELEYRERLRKEGRIRYFGGKQELIARGYFDDVDMSLMFHSLDLQGKKALVGPESNGFIGKNIRFTGRAAHAGSAPEDGINALNAASLAMMNIHAQRETFRDRDRVRVHPIVTKGGDIVNVVPHDVRMESYVRARTIEGMKDANEKVNRAIEAGALAVGADVEISDIPGYMPIRRYRELDDLYSGNMRLLGCGEEDLIDGGDFTGSFDFGDVSQLMPTLHPMMGGISGALHSCDYRISDPEAAYLLPAKALALTVVDLLAEDAAGAKSVLKDFKTPMTKREYLEFMEGNDRRIRRRNMD